MSNLFTSKWLLINIFALFLINVVTAQTTISGSFIYGGVERTYRLYIPAIYNPTQAVPLLFNLHGYGSNNIEQELYGDFRPIADTAGFIIAHPNGTLDFTGTRHWNTFGTSTVDDLGFLSALIDTISAGYTIDHDRVYSTGMSNGGFMSYELACFLSDRIAAVASVTGSMIWSRLNACDPQHPTPVMQIHGTADATVPYNGNAFFVPVDTLVKRWVTFNNCLPDPQIIQVPDIDPNDGCTAEQHIFGNGDNEATVELFKVLGGGHSWPGAPININITNMDFSASVEIWRFVSQYSLDGLTTGNIGKLAHFQQVEVFPNPSAGKIYLRFFDDSPKSISILNSIGQVIEQATFSGNETTFNLHEKGVYLITIRQSNDRIFSKKVIVQ